jgi:hypothetical protein
VPSRSRIKRATLAFVGLFLVDAEPVFSHHFVAFLRIDVGIHIQRLVIVLATRGRGHALVFRQIVLEDLAVTVALQLIHSGLVPGACARKPP